MAAAAAVVVVGRGMGLERWLARSAAAEHQASPLSASMVITCLFFV